MPNPVYQITNAGPQPIFLRDERGGLIEVAPGQSSPPSEFLPYFHEHKTAPFSLWAMIARSVRSLMRSAGAK